MASDTKPDGAKPVFVLSSFEIARRLKERFANANQAGAAMPHFARALVYKMWEGGANVTQDTLLRFTDALAAYDRDSDSVSPPAAPLSGPAVHPGDADLTIDLADGDVPPADTTTEVA